MDIPALDAPPLVKHIVWGEPDNISTWCIAAEATHEGFDQEGRCVGCVRVDTELTVAPEDFENVEDAIDFVRFGDEPCGTFLTVRLDDIERFQRVVAAIKAGGLIPKVSIQNGEIIIDAIQQEKVQPEDFPF